MFLRWARPDRDRRALRRAAAAVALIVTLGPAGTSRAVPFDEPQLGGIGFSGPTTGDLAAVYWNPAALGLLQNPQLMVAGTGSRITTTVQRAPIDPATGLPGGGQAFPLTRSTVTTQPATWMPGPGTFVGVGSDVGGDRFALAVAAYVPFSERTSYEGANDPAQPTRYHRISADLRTLALVPALAVRLSGDLRLGLAPGFLLSTGRLVFAETTCGLGGHGDCAAAEDPSADVRYDVGSNSSLGSAKFAVTLGGGLYYRRRGWEAGLAFSSRPLGSTGISGDDATITRPTRDGGAPVTCMNGRTDGRGCVFADVSFKLPFIVTAGVAWHPRPGAELAVLLRYLNFPSDDEIDIRLAGPALTDSGLPQHIVLHRGYDTVYDLRARFAQWLGERVRVGVGLRMETSALPASDVSPGAVDGLKLQPTAMIMVRPLKHLTLGVGYGFTYMFDVTASPSAFDPGAARLCEQEAGDLASKACQARQHGLARPTAAGTYGSHRHDLTLSLATHF